MACAVPVVRFEPNTVAREPGATESATKLAALTAPNGAMAGTLQSDGSTVARTLARIPGFGDATFRVMKICVPSAIPVKSVLPLEPNWPACGPVGELRWSWILSGADHDTPKVADELAHVDAFRGESASMLPLPSW